MKNERTIDVWIGSDDLFANRVVADCESLGLRVSCFFGSEFGEITGSVSHGNRLQIFESDRDAVREIIVRLHLEMYGVIPYE